MKNTNTFSKVQFYSLVVLRLFIGWHLLYEGIAKLLNPSWSSVEFLRETQWIMSGFADWIMSNDSILKVVDILNTWGLIAIGTGLILGLFSRVACISGAILLFVYYLNAPPLTGLEYSLPGEGDYLIINKTLIEAITLFVLSVFPTSHILGLDLFRKRKTQKIK